VNVVTAIIITVINVEFLILFSNRLAQEHIIFNSNTVMPQLD
jgi:hypothetical protein